MVYNQIYKANVPNTKQNTPISILSISEYFSSLLRIIWKDIKITSRYPNIIKYLISFLLTQSCFIPFIFLVKLSINQFWISLVRANLAISNSQVIRADINLTKSKQGLQ